MAWSKKEQENLDKNKPVTYSDELFNTICDRLSEGESLRKICEDAEMPSKSNVLKWIRDSKELQDQYARAKQESSDAWAEEMIDIIKDTKEDSNAIQKARLQIDTMKWLMSKQKPKKYGDKLDLTSDGKALPTPIYGGKSGTTRGTRN